jgi:hypothetical protein
MQDGLDEREEEAVRERAAEARFCQGYVDRRWEDGGACQGGDDNWKGRQPMEQECEISSQHQ